MVFVGVIPFLIPPASEISQESMVQGTSHSREAAASEVLLFLSRRWRKLPGRGRRGWLVGWLAGCAFGWVCKRSRGKEMGGELKGLKETKRCFFKFEEGNEGG